MTTKPSAEQWMLVCMTKHTLWHQIVPRKGRRSQLEALYYPGDNTWWLFQDGMGHRKYLNAADWCRVLQECLDALPTGVAR